MHAHFRQPCPFEMKYGWNKAVVLKTAASVQAIEGGLTGKAGQDIRIDSGVSTISITNNSFARGSGFLISGSSTINKSLQRQDVTSSTFEGKTVLLDAGRDLTVRGSNIVSDTQTTLMADRNVRIESATSSLNTTNFEAHRTSGLTLDGPSLFIGSKSNSNDLKAQSTTQVGSNVASLQGNVTILAGNKATVQASNLIAPGTVVDGKTVGGDISVIAKSIDILDAQNTASEQTESKTRQSGLTISVGSPLISAAQTVVTTLDAVGETKSGRMQLLGVAGAGLSLYNSKDAIKGAADALAGPNPQNAFTLNASLGTSKSQSNSATNSTTSAGSTLAAGGNLTLSATGDGKNSNLTIAGSQVLADGNIRLIADNQVNLIAGVNTSNETNSNKSSSASVGVSYSPVSGFGFNAAANRSKGSGAGEGTSFTNTTTAAGNNLTITSGGNTNLIGATAAGKQVTVDVGKTFGGNLTIESVQDKNTYNESSRSSGGSISIGGGSSFGGSVSAGNTKINSNFASVNEQSKISAGDGGFNVTVAGNTTLTGGQITSTQKAVDAGLNGFTTGTKNADGSLQPGTGNLTITDLNNTAVYSASGYSVTAGFSIGKDNKTGENKTTPTGSAGVGSSSGNAASITVGGITGIAGNKDVRTGDAQTGLAPIFNRGEVSADVNARVTITAQFGSQASTAIGNYAQEEMNRARGLMTQAAQTIDPIERQRLINEANEIDQKWGVNGTLRIGALTVVGGLTGGASGAAGTLASAVTSSSVSDALTNVGITGPLNTVITGLAGTTVGGAVGGTPGAAGGFNEVTNNLLSHPSLVRDSKFISNLNNLGACTSKESCERNGAVLAAQINALSDTNIAQMCKSDTQCVTDRTTERTLYQGTLRQISEPNSVRTNITTQVVTMLYQPGGAYTQEQISASVNRFMNRTGDTTNNPIDAWVHSNLIRTNPVTLGNMMAAREYSLWGQDGVPGGGRILGAPPAATNTPMTTRVPPRPNVTDVADTNATTGATNLATPSAGNRGASNTQPVLPPLNTTPVYPAGQGAATMPLPNGYSMVSRWVSPEEASIWVRNGGNSVPSNIPNNNTPILYITEYGAPRPAGATGTVRIDFGVPNNMIQSGNTATNRTIIQPVQSTPIFGVQIHVPVGTQLPAVRR